MGRLRVKLQAHDHNLTDNNAIYDKKVEMLFDCCTSNANSSSVSVGNTQQLCHVLFGYLHSFVHASFSYRTASMGRSGCYQQTSVPVYSQPCSCQLDRNCNHQISTSIRVEYWWHRVLFCQRTVVDADHRSGRTQIFGGKASETETSGPLVKRNFTYPTCISHPRSCWGWFDRNFVVSVAS